MSAEQGTKNPLEKSPEYMRKAYLYTGVLFLVAVIGSMILAWRITDAETRERAAQEAQQLEEEGVSGQQERRR